MEGVDNIGYALALLMPVIIYFMPTFVAFYRNKKNAVAIFVINLFLGWTLVGWVVALAWAFMRD